MTYQEIQDTIEDYTGGHFLKMQLCDVIDDYQRMNDIQVESEDIKEIIDDLDVDELIDDSLRNVVNKMLKDIESRFKEKKEKKYGEDY